MRDVAALAGVSLKTVSRVVNLELNVNAERRRRVEEAVAALGFRPNVVARSLASGGHPRVVGLIITDLLNPVYAAYAKAVETVAKRNRSVVVLVSSGEDSAIEKELVTDLLRLPVDGLIIVSVCNDHRYLEQYQRLGSAIVFLATPGGNIDADAVILDNEGGSRVAVEHLIGCGHRRIGFMSGPERLYSARSRLDGYREALVGAGIPWDPALVKQGLSSTEQAQVVARHLINARDGPTAVFAANNRNCIGLLRAIRATQKNVAVIGFDDFELADMLPVPVTVVGYDAGELARAAAELLFSRLAGDSRPCQRIVLPPRLIVRGSGEISPDTSGGEATPD
jgi:LacI family transcriptional regulator